MKKGYSHVNNNAWKYFFLLTEHLFKMDRVGQKLKLYASLSKCYKWHNTLIMHFFFSFCRSGSVKNHWHEIFSFVESLTEKFTRYILNNTCIFGLMSVVAFHNIESIFFMSTFFFSFFAWLAYIKLDMRKHSQICSEHNPLCESLLSALNVNCRPAKGMALPADDKYSLLIKNPYLIMVWFMKMNHMQYRPFSKLSHSTFPW